MTTYVLVPGAWHGGWYFQPVTDALRRQGHRVFPVTLTGVGERSHLTCAAANLETHIADVVSILDCEQIEHAVLCAHSYGGMVITGVADRLPERVSALVHIDSSVPDDGESHFGLVTQDFRDSFIAAARVDGYSVSPPPGLDDRVTPHPLASLMQAIRLHGASEAIANKIYVWLSEWPNSPTKPMYERMRQRPGWDVQVWPISHDVVGQAADDLVELLIAAAQQ